MGLASDKANSRGWVHRHRGRLADADVSKAPVRRSMEGARGVEVVVAVEGGSDEDVGDAHVVEGYEKKEAALVIKYLVAYISLSTADGLTKSMGVSVGSHVKGLGEGAVGMRVRNMSGGLVPLVSRRGGSKTGHGGDGGDDGRRMHLDGIY